MLGSELRRDKVQIIIEILQLCMSPQLKTRVMQKTNISYKIDFL